LDLEALGLRLRSPFVNSVPQGTFNFLSVETRLLFSIRFKIVAEYCYYAFYQMWNRQQWHFQRIILESNSRKRNCIIGLTQGRIQPVSLGGAISVIFGSQVSLRVHSVKEMKYTSQHCCDKTVDGKMALYRECCFLNCSKIIVKKVTFVGFRRVIAPIAPRGSAPGLTWVQACNQRGATGQFLPKKF